MSEFQADFFELKKETTDEEVLLQLQDIESILKNTKGQLVEAFDSVFYSSDNK
jgi:hypothetical protein